MNKKSFINQKNIKILILLCLIPYGIFAQNEHNETSKNQIQLYSVEDFSKFDVTNNTAEYINKALELGDNGMVEIKERKNFVNKFEISAAKIMTIVDYPKGILYTGKIILLFFKNIDDKENFAYYAGDMKNGFADGYGVFSSKTKGIQGFWQNGIMLREMEAMQSLMAGIAQIDFKKEFGHKNVTDVESSSYVILYNRDFFNNALENGYLLAGKVTWKENGKDHSMDFALNKPDFIKPEEIIINPQDKSSKDSYFNHNLYKGGEFYIRQIYSAFMNYRFTGSTSGDPAYLSNLIGLILYGISNDSNKETDPEKIAFKAVYTEFIRRCIVIEDQFDPIDSLSGVWYDKAHNLIIYICPKETGKIFKFPINYATLFTFGKTYQSFLTEGTYKLDEGRVRMLYDGQIESGRLTDKNHLYIEPYDYLIRLNGIKEFPR